MRLLPPKYLSKNLTYIKYLVILSLQIEDDPPVPIDVTESSVSVGRGIHNDISIARPFISSVHAKFMRTEDGQCELVDCDSSNGTFVNGERIHSAVVKPGDLLTFGALEAKVLEVETGPVARAPVAEESESKEATIPFALKGAPVPVSGGKLPGVLAAQSLGQKKDQDQSGGEDSRKAELEALALQLRKKSEELEAARGRLSARDSEIAELKSQVEHLQQRADGLERIQDILSAKNIENEELKSQAAELQRLGEEQAETLRQKDRELTYAKREEEDLKEKLADAQASLTRQKEAGEKEARLLRDRNDEIQVALAKARVEIESVRKEAGSLQARIRRYESQLEELDERKKEIRKLEEEKSEALGELKDREGRLAETKAEIEFLTSRVKGFEAKMEELAEVREDINSSIQELDSIRDSIGKARIEEAALLAAFAQKKTETVEELTENKSSAEKEIAEIRAKADAELRQVKTEIAEDRKTLAELRKDRDGVRDDLADLRAKCAGLEREQAKRQEELAAARAELEKSENRRNTVDGQVRELSQEKESLEETLKANYQLLGNLKRDIESKAELQQELDSAKMRSIEVSKRELKAAKHELRLRNQAEEESALVMRVKELRKEVADTEKRYQISRKKLERKLGELKFAEDRIELADKITAQTQEASQHFPELKSAD